MSFGGPFGDFCGDASGDCKGEALFEIERCFKAMMFMFLALCLNYYGIIRPSLLCLTVIGLV